MVAMTPQAWYEWLNCSILGYITAASMMIHHPVKKRTPAAMEATVFRFSPQSMHSEHLEPSRNPDIFSGQSKSDVAARLAASVHSSSARKQNSHRQPDSRASFLSFLPSLVAWEAREPIAFRMASLLGSTPGRFSRTL